MHPDSPSTRPLHPIALPALMLLSLGCARPRGLQPAPEPAAARATHELQLEAPAADEPPPIAAPRYAPPPAPANAAVAPGWRQLPQPQPQPPAQPQPGEDREGYAHAAEAEFVDASDRPLSTFSIDVDSASWARTRRFVEQEQRLPPAHAVRIEEFVNAFPYRWPGPQDDRPFAVHSEVSVAPWNPEHRLMAVAVQGRRVANEQLPPANLVFLLDVSGSMNAPDKLPLLKQSLGLLVRELRPQDRVSIVVYAGAAGVVLPPTAGDDACTILDALERLQAGGGTAGAEGIELAYRVARRSFVAGGNNRVILATDGDFNVGPSSDDELTALVERERDAGVSLTVLGFGRGDLQDGKMQVLAQHGNGNAAYIDSILEAHRVLVGQMGGTLLTIAQDVKIQVEPNPRLVQAYRLIGYDTRRLADRDFDDDTKDAGELGAGHTVTALYEIIPRETGWLEDDDAPAPPTRHKYSHVHTTAAASAHELATVKLRYKLPQEEESELLEHVVQDRGVAIDDASADLRFASAVVELGLLLRQSRFAGSASIEAAIERAAGALGDDPGGYRREFVAVARRVARLTRAE